MNANGIEFIQSSRVVRTVEDSSDALLKEFIENEHLLKAKMGLEEYNNKLELLKILNKDE
jgi:hypothetical protein